MWKLLFELVFYLKNNDKKALESSFVNEKFKSQSPG